MERLKLRCRTAEKALKTLESILKERYSVVIRDATVQRFEYTFEVVWKFLKAYLKEKEGRVSNSPKSCFREAFALELMSAEETELLLKMVDSRNETPHTYEKEIAENIFKQIKVYAPLMRKLLETLKQEI